MLALSTAISAAGGTVALRFTRRWSRIAAMRLGAACYAAWCAVGLAALLLPPGWRPAELLAATLLAAVGGLLFGAGQRAGRGGRARSARAGTWPGSSTPTRSQAWSHPRWSRCSRWPPGYRGCWSRPAPSWPSRSCGRWPPGSRPTPFTPRPPGPGPPRPLSRVRPARVRPPRTSQRDHAARGQGHRAQPHAAGPEDGVADGRSDRDHRRLAAARRRLVRPVQQHHPTCGRSASRGTR